MLSKWQKINTVLLKKNATLQKNAKILDNGLVQTTRFFGKECEGVLCVLVRNWPVVAPRGSIMARQLA